jgi:hypothetical protein
MPYFTYNNRMRFFIRLRRQFRRYTYRMRQYLGTAETLIIRPGRFTPRIVALSLMMVFAGVLGFDALPRAAEAATTDTTMVVAMPLCRTKAQERRALRLQKWHRSMNCRPAGFSSSSSRSSSSSSSSRSSSSSSSSSSSLGALDTLPITTAHPQFVLLGETGPVLGAAKIFMNDEGLDVSSISVTLTESQTGVDSLLIYNDQNRFVGRARLDPSMSTNRTYTLQVPAGSLIIERRTDRRFYVRAQLLSRDFGATGNQTVELSGVTFRGTGVWSNWPYTQSTSEIFPTYITARSTITGITNALQKTAPLVSGTNKNIAAFAFTGRTSDSSAHVDVTRLVFEIGQTGGVTVTNVTLGTPGFPERFPCTVTASQIICSGIPDSFGAIGSDGRTLALYADVTTSGTQTASLQISLNEMGNPSNAGSVWWNDGTTTFDWVALDVQSVSGTNWKY